MTALAGFAFGAIAGAVVTSVLWMLWIYRAMKP